MLDKGTASPVTLNRLRLAVVITAVLANCRALAEDNSGLEEIVVTAEKRPESVQRVPLSVRVLDERTLEQLQAHGFDDYLKYLPSLTATTSLPGEQDLTIRGVSNGTDGLRVGSQPSVAVYFDEQPVTLIGDNLDVHLYDIARIEELSGPQGTLFGASALGGALRIIPNSPDHTQFSAGYHLDGNITQGGGLGGLIEGYVNLPLTEAAAIRLVGFTEHDGGYINNVPSSLTFPTSGATLDNASQVRRNFNPVDTQGARAALEVVLGDYWTITPSTMMQRRTVRGVPGFEPLRGDLNVSIYTPWSTVDNWYRAALTVQGKIGNFDLVYAGGYLDRDVRAHSDYAVYSHAYDVYYAATPDYFGNLYRDNSGTPISPLQTSLQSDSLRQTSHEVRLSSPKEWRGRFVAGLFLEHQIDDNQDIDSVKNLADNLSITGQPGVVYLNDLNRVDRSRAAFGEFSVDLVQQLTLTGGFREFWYDNTVYGFSGYGGNFRPASEVLCFAGTAAVAGSGRPCIDVDQRAARSGSTHKVNLSYQMKPEHLLYATWATGFRPGGINRTKDALPYRPDYLANIELGSKDSWWNNHLQLDTAMFYERWKDAQYAVCGPNCVHEVINVGAARILGLESQLRWVPFTGLTLTGAFTWLDARLLANACRYGAQGEVCLDPTGLADPEIQPLAVRGSPLPPPKSKASFVIRYNFELASLNAHAQAAAQGQSASHEQPTATPGYGTIDVLGGIAQPIVNVDLYVKNLFDRRASLARFNQCGLSNCTPGEELPIAPRLLGLSISHKF